MSAVSRAPLARSKAFLAPALCLLLLAPQAAFASDAVLPTEEAQVPPPTPWIPLLPFLGELALAYGVATPAPAASLGYAEAAMAYLALLGRVLPADVAETLHHQASGLTPSQQASFALLFHALAQRQRTAEAVFAQLGSEPSWEQRGQLLAGQLGLVAAVQRLVPELLSGPAPREDTPVLDLCGLVLLDLNSNDDARSCDYVFSFDYGGDDLLTGNAGGGSGAHAAFLAPLSMDLVGDDTYRRATSAIGSHSGGARGALGALVDARGNDRYVATVGAEGATGSGVDGAGMLLDLAGDDLHDITVSGPGAAGGSVAGSQGLGILLDLAGDDRYLARGPTDQPAALHGSAVALAGHALLLDATGNDAYLDTTGPCRLACGASNGATVPLYLAEGHLVYLWPIDAWTAYSRIALPQAFASLLDLAGDDWYDTNCKTKSWRNGAWGLLEDLEGRDTYADGVVWDVKVPPFFAERCEEGVADESLSPKPSGIGPYGHQLDRFAYAWVWPLRSVAAVSPPFAVAQGPGQACVFGTCTEDPFLLSRKALDCAAGVDLDAWWEVCPEALDPDAGIADDLDERRPTADGGQVFWMRGNRLFALNVFTTGLGPIAAARDVLDYRAHGGHVAWRDSLGQVSFLNLATSQREVLGRATGEIDFDGRHVAWESEGRVEVFDVAGRAGPVVVGEGVKPRVSADHVVFLDGSVPVVASLSEAFRNGQGSPRRLPGFDGWKHGDAHAVAIDGDLVAWTGTRGVWAFDLYDPWRRYIAVGQNEGAKGDLDIAGNFVVWVKGGSLLGTRDVIVGRDVSHLRHTREDGLLGHHWSLTQDYDEALGLLDEYNLVSHAAAGGAEVVVSDALAQGLVGEHARSPRASTNLVTWEQCASVGPDGRCASESDVYYAHLLGPDVVGVSAAGGLENCYNSASVHETPETLLSSEVGAPDLNEDGLGDCWAGYYAQALGEALDLLWDLDCDTLNNLEDFRWQLHPLYDVPPLWCNLGPELSGLVLFPHGRDFDGDRLLDGHEARFIERANGGGPLTFDDLVRSLLEEFDQDTVALALYHPLKDHDVDGDGERDMEDLNSDGTVTEANPVSDTIQDGVEVWLFDTFPDFGDSDCSAASSASEDGVCHGSRGMVAEEAVLSEDRGTGDGMDDAQEVYYWLVDEDLDGLHLREIPGKDQLGFTIVVDDIDNPLLDPDSDGDGTPDGEECLLAVAGGSAGACEAGFQPLVGPQARAPPPGGPPEGGFGPGGPTLASVKAELLAAYGDLAGARGPACPSASNPDSDGDGFFDTTELLLGTDPCRPEGALPPALAALFPPSGRCGSGVRLDCQSS